jgi:predicted oxidoreductase
LLDAAVSLIFGNTLNLLIGLELGITTFDLADIYGGKYFIIRFSVELRSSTKDAVFSAIGYAYEELFGKGLALKPELREKMQL